MRGILAALVAFVCVLVAPPAWAGKYVPPPIAGHVTDKAGKLSANEISSLNEKLADYRRCSTNHIAVFFPASLEGNSIDDVAYATFNTWHIGEGKKDNGVLLVMAPAERKVRIETGKGVGGQLTDLESAHILQRDVTPNLKAEKFYVAANQATTSIAKALGGCEVKSATGAPMPEIASASLHDFTMATSAWVLGFGILMAVSFALFRMPRWICALVGLGSAAFGYGLVVLLSRAPGGYDLGKGLINGIMLVACGAISALTLGLVRKARDNAKAAQKKSRRGGGGAYDNSWSSGSSSDYSSGASDYSGGGGSSGGGGASDSY